MKIYKAKSDIYVNGKVFKAGERYEDKDLKGIGLNNFIFEGVVKEKQTPKNKVVKKRGRPKSK